MTMNRVSPRAPLKSLTSLSSLAAGLFASGLIVLAFPSPVRSQGCCAGPLGPGDCNVFWTPTDSVTACPAGDSVYTGRASRLYIKIHYEDNNCQVRQGVPPESIWVTYKTTTGNLVLNDKGAKVFADDSTNSAGNTWITLRSFSGCGALRCTLYVSGKKFGAKTMLVRTTDSDGDGRVETSEGSSVCDLNYDGVANDSQIAAAHVPDWKRNALHGTLVKRTNLCDLCPLGDPNTLGTGDLSWSPSGRRLVFSVNNAAGVCKIFDAASDPSGGNSLRQLSFSTAPADSHDYDPTWSPLSDEIFFFRQDKVIYRKGIPGLATDTSLIAIYGNDTLKCCGAVSPDGRTIAFSQSTGTGYTIRTVSATGGAPRRITAPGSYRDFYPKWSPDGQNIIFERRTFPPPPATPVRSLYTVPAFDDPPPPPTLFYEPAGLFALLPSYAEDRAIVVAGVGAQENVPTSNTLDATGTTGFRPIGNYPAYTFPWLFPRMSPDGTRLAMEAKNPAITGALGPQVWAVRRNMNLPPNFTAIGGQSVADSTARVYFTMLRGQLYSFTVAASDPPDPVPDHLTYAAYYLQQGMAFDTSTRTFSWTPPDSAVGKVFHVKFQVTTPSGGADAILAVINVVQSLGPGGSRARTATPIVSASPEGDGRIRFELQGPVPQEVHVTVYDLAGRRLARLEGRGTDALRWDGRDESGRQVPSGVYFYRVQGQGTTLSGRLVYLR